MCDACMWVCSVHTCMWRPKNDRCLLLFLPYRQGLSLNRKLTILTRLTAHHGLRIWLFQLPNARVMGMCYLPYAWPFICVLEIWTQVCVLAQQKPLSPVWAFWDKIYCVPQPGFELASACLPYFLKSGVTSVSYHTQRARASAHKCLLYCALPFSPGSHPH